MRSKTSAGADVGKGTVAANFEKFQLWSGVIVVTQEVGYRLGAALEVQEEK